MTEPDFVPLVCGVTCDASGNPNGFSTHTDTRCHDLTVGGIPMTSARDEFFSRRLHVYCMATLRDGRGCLVDRDEHAGVPHRFSAEPSEHRHRDHHGSDMTARPNSVTFKIPHGATWCIARIRYGMDGGSDLPHGHAVTWDWNKTRRSLAVAIAKWLAWAPERGTDQ